MQPKRFSDSARANDDYLKRLGEPISESGRVAFETAAKHGTSISPQLAEAIAKEVRASAGLPEDASEKKPVLGFDFTR